MYNINLQNGGDMSKIIKFSVGDTLEMKKKHPCGASRFKVMRTGSDVRIICEGCGRDLSMPRVALERSIKKVISVGGDTQPEN